MGYEILFIKKTGLSTMYTLNMSKLSYGINGCLNETEYQP